MSYEVHHGLQLLQRQQAMARKVRNSFCSCQDQSGEVVQRIAMHDLRYLDQR